MPAVQPAAAAGTVVVTTYGATGTGATNDTHAFVSALADLDGMGGGTLVVPPGNYLVDPDAINVHSHIVVSGAGARLFASHGGNILLDLNGSGIEVDGLTIDGTQQVLHVVEIERGSTNITVRGATVENAGQPPNNSAQVVGIRVQGDGNSMTFDGVTVQNIVATNSDGTSMIARGLLLDTGGGASTVSKHVSVVNSTFFEVAPKDDGDCIVIQNSSDVDAALVIDNNQFDRCHKRAIKLQVGGVTVTNNHINNPFHGDNAYKVRQEKFDPATGKPTFDMFSAIAAHASDIVIQNNTVGGTGSFYMGLEVDNAQGTGPIQNLTLTGTSIANGPGSETGAPSSMVRSAVGINGLTIENNVFTNAPYGMFLEQPVTNATITCNTYVAISNQTANANGTETPCDVPPVSGGGPGGSPSPGATPELDSLVLFASGLGGLAMYIPRMRRRRKGKSSR